MLTKLYKPSEFDKEKGFTLIELLVVIVIIGILAAIALPIFLNQQKAAIAASVKSDTHNTLIAVQTALVTNPNATGFVLVRPADTVTYAFVPSVISTIGKTANITVPSGEVAVQATITNHNWVAINGNSSGYVIHVQSEDSCFWTEYNSATGVTTNSDTSGAVEALTSTSGAIDLNGPYTVTLGSCTGSGSGSGSGSGPAASAPVFLTSGGNQAAAAIGAPYDLPIVVTGTPFPALTAVGLPDGLTFSFTGAITGVVTNTATIKTYAVIITASNASGTKTLNINIPVTPQPIAPTAFTSGTTIPAGSEGSSYTTTFAADGSPAPTYSATGLPAGLSIDPTTGVLSGTPTTTNSGTITVTATNSAGSFSVTPTLNITFGTFNYGNYFNNGASDVAAFAPHQGGAATAPILAYSFNGVGYCKVSSGESTNTGCMEVSLKGAAGLADAPGIQLTLSNVAAGTYAVSWKGMNYSGTAWDHWTVRVGSNSGVTSTKVSGPIGGSLVSVSTTVTVTNSGTNTFIFSPNSWSTSNANYYLDDFVITRTS